MNIKMHIIEDCLKGQLVGFKSKAEAIKYQVKLDRAYGGRYINGEATSQYGTDCDGIIEQFKHKPKPVFLTEER